MNGQEPGSAAMMEGGTARGGLALAATSAGRSDSVQPNAPSAAIEQHWARLRVEVLDSIEAAEAPWRTLERTALFTPYQSYDWIAHWHAARGAQGQVAIVVLFDGTEPVALLPLEVRRSLGLRRAMIIGTSIGNSDWLMMTPEVAPLLAGGRVSRLLVEAAPQVGGIDLLAFFDQPASWGGVDNPLLALPHQPGPNHFYFSARDAAASFDRFDDKRLGNLERRRRKLAEAMGPVVLRMAASVAEIDRVHAAFLEQRAARFAQQGIANIFAEPHFVRFMRDAAIDALGSERPSGVFHALYAGDTIVATSFGTFAGTHYSQYINATAAGDIAKFRLIGILMHDLFADCARRGALSIDMGLGDFGYKTDWTEPRTVHDSVIPLSPVGQVAAPVQLALRGVKRAIKQNPQVFDLYKRLRSRMRGAQA